jgi:ATP-dependent Clp protease adaptor protein ClpS
VGLWDAKPKVTLAEEVSSALARAHAEATRRRQTEVTSLHVLCALLDTPSVETCLHAMRIEPRAARNALARELTDLPRHGWLSFRPAVASAGYEKVLTSAIAKLMAAGLAEVTAPLLVAYLVSQDDALVSYLAPLGFTRLGFLQVVAHGDAAPPPPPAEGLVIVTIVNDPFSTMALVVDTLREVFGITNEPEAVELMMRVHRSGRAALGTMDAAIARRKIDETHARAAAAGMPLRVLGERVS